MLTVNITLNTGFVMGCIYAPFNPTSQKEVYTL